MATNAFELWGEIALRGSQQVEQQLKSLGDKAKATGDKMKSLGEGMSKWLTVPLAAVGAGAMKVANDMQVSQGSIQAQLGVSAEEAKALHNTAKELWSKGFGTDMADVTNKVAAVTRSLGDLDKQELKAVTGGMDMLQQQFGAEPQENLNAMKSLMKNFGMSATEAMDYLTSGYQQNLDYSGEFTDTIREYSTYFNEMGFSGNEMFSVLKSGAEGGAFQLDKVGDSMKEFTLRAKDGSTASTEAFQALGLNANEMTAAFNKGGEDGRIAFQKVVTALQNTDDETLKNKASVALFGTQYEDLGEEAFNSLLKASNSMGVVEGATAKAGAAMRENFGTRLTSLWREAQVALEPLGHVLIDMAEQILPKLSAGIQTVSGWFTNMSPAAQQIVTVLGLLAAAAGPVLVVVGQIIGSLGNFIPVITKTVSWVTKAGGVMRVLQLGFAALTGPVGLTVAAITLLVTAGVALYKNWDTIKNHPMMQGTAFQALMIGVEKVAGLFKSSIPPVDNFGNKVSEATKKSVTSLTNLADQGTQKLTLWHGQAKVISQQMATELTGTYNKMATDVVAALERQKTEGIQKQTEFFSQSGALTEEREAEILQSQTDNYNQQILKTQEGNTRINEIIQTAANEHRNITTAEKDEINRIKNDMVETGIKAMSKNELESRTILTKMKANSDEMNAQMAANVVKESLKSRDGAITAAKETFNGKMEEITRLRDESGVISAEEADKLIEEAKREKNDTIAAAKEMHSGVITEAKAQAGEHVNEVDWSTGEIKSKWTIMKDDVIGKAKELGSNIKTAWTDFTDRMKENNEKGRVDSGIKWGQLRDDVSTKAKELGTNAKNALDDLKTKASEKFGSLQTDGTTKFENLKKAASEKFGSMKSDTVTKAGELYTGASNKFEELKKAAGTKFSDLTSNAKTLFGGLQTDSGSKFGSMKSDLTTKATDIQTKVKSSFSDLTTKAKGNFGDILSSATSKFNSIRDAIKNPVETARSKVDTAIRNIKGYFSGLKLSLPKNIATPHFKIKNWSLNPANWVKNKPYIAIEWYKKGGIFDGSSVIGVGEKGPEAVVPLLGRAMTPFARAIAENMPAPTAGSGALKIEIPVYLNGREIARAIAPDMDQALERERRKHAIFKGGS